jgi:hypothetical protein
MAKSLVALVGTKFRGREAMDVLASLPNGEPLALIREPTNQYDPRCVQVWARDVHIGFLKKDQNQKISHRMDQNPDFRAAMSSGLSCKLAIDGGRQPMVEISE